MARRVFVDTAWNSKQHLCYDPDEDGFFEVNDLAELAGRYDEVYLDSSIFPNMWPQLERLISNGVRVFHFAWPWKWRKIREKYADLLKEKFGKKKTDQGDAYILSKIYGEPKAFREITPLDVEFRPMLMKERKMARILLELHHMQMLGIDVENEINDHEDRLRKVRGEIVRRAEEEIPGFREVIRELGLSDDDVNALSALAGLLIYLGWPYEVKSMHKAIRYLGLYKPTKENMKKFEERYGEKYLKRYNGGARRCLNMLTATMSNREKGIFPPKARDEKEVLRRLLNTLRTRKFATRLLGERRGRIKALMRPVVRNYSLH